MPYFLPHESLTLRDFDFTRALPTNVAFVRFPRITQDENSDERYRHHGRKDVVSLSFVNYYDSLWQQCRDGCVRPSPACVHGAVSKELTRC